MSGVFVVLYHIIPQFQARYVQPIRDLGVSVKVVPIVAGAYSASYDGRNGVARKPFHDLLSENGYREGDRVVMVGFSAGCWALRHYLSKPQGQSGIDCAVYVDGLHGGLQNGQCSSISLRGTIEFENTPGKLLCVSFSQIKTEHEGYASTSNCARVAEAAYQGGGEAYFISGVDDDGQPLWTEPGEVIPDAKGSGSGKTAHARQLQLVGPAMMGKIVAPWLRYALQVPKPPSIDPEIPPFQPPPELSDPPTPIVSPPKRQQGKQGKKGVSNMAIGAGLVAAGAVVVGGSSR